MATKNVSRLRGNSLLRFACCNFLRFGVQTPDNARYLSMYHILLFLWRLLRCAAWFFLEMLLNSDIFHAKMRSPLYNLFCTMKLEVITSSEQ